MVQSERLALIRERAESAISILVGIALGVLLVAGIGVAGTTAMRAVASAGAVQAASLSTTQLLGGLERDAHGALAVFVPVDDAFGHDNGDGHELDLYARDAAGNGSFAAYCYDASGASCAGASTAGTLSRYHGSWSQHANGTMALDGATYTGLTSFSATTYHVDELSDAAKDAVSAQLLATAGVTPVRREFDVGYTGARYSEGNGVVRAGNPVSVVHVVSPGGDRTVHLAAGILPTTVQIAFSTYTPPPNVPTAGGSGTNLVFASPLYPSSLAAVITERNYGTNPSATRAQVYTATGAGGADCAVLNDAGAAPKPVATPLGDGSGTATLTVTPVIRAQPGGATCIVQYSDNVPNGIVFNVTIGATQTPALVYATPPRSTAGASYFFATESIGVRATEGNYPDSAHGGGFSGWTACAGVTPGAETGSSGDHSTASQVAAFSSAATSSCLASVRDAYGQSAGTPAVQVVGDLGLTSGNAITFNAPGDAAQNVTVSERGATWALTASGCGGVASITTNGSSAPNGSWAISPIAPGTCTVTIADPAGAQPYVDGSGAAHVHVATVSVAVTVDVGAHDICDTAYGTYVSTTPGSPPTRHYGSGAPCSSSVTWSAPSVSVNSGATSGSFTATAGASGGFGDDIVAISVANPSGACASLSPGAASNTQAESFTVFGAAPGSCTVTAADTYGKAATITIIVNATAPPVSTPPPATPTPSADPGRFCSPPVSFGASGLDAYGYYNVLCHNSTVNEQCAIYGPNGQYKGKSVFPNGTRVYLIYDATGRGSIFKEIFTASMQDCSGNTVDWSDPGGGTSDPASYYNDPNLI